MMAPTDNRLTPDVVQAVAFPPARIGRRGLDADHVRAFCGLVERELVRLRNERASLASEVERLRRRVLGQSGGVHEPGSRPGGDANAQAVRILSEAQQTAQRHVANAQEYSMRLAAEAQRRRDEMIAEAQSHARVLLERATAPPPAALEPASSPQSSLASVPELAAGPGPGSSPGRQLGRSHMTSCQFDHRVS